MPAAALELKKQNKDTYAADLPKTFQEAKDQGLPVFKFFTDGPARAVSLSAGGGDGTGDGGVDENSHQILLTASTTVTDLAGDNITPQCLEQMRQAAVGTTIFLNHSFDVPQDLFGVVVKAFLKERQDETSGETYLCLDLIVEVEMSNPAAAKTYEIIRNGKVKLGASITILILESETLADGTYSILSVKYLETSIVGLPMNQNSWVRQAVKALKWLERTTTDNNNNSSQKQKQAQIQQPSNQSKKQQNHQKQNSGPAPTQQQKAAPVSTKGISKMKKTKLVHKNAFDEVLADGATATCQDLCEALCGAVDNLLEQADAKALDDPMGALKELLSDFEDALIAHVKPALDSMAEEDDEESDEEEDNSDNSEEDDGSGSGGSDNDNNNNASYSLERAREFFTWKTLEPANTRKANKGKLSHKSEADDLVDDPDGDAAADRDGDDMGGPWQEIHDMALSRGANCVADGFGDDGDDGADSDSYDGRGTGKSVNAAGAGLLDPKKIKDSKVKAFVLGLQKENQELADAAEAATKLLEVYSKQPLI